MEELMSSRMTYDRAVYAELEQARQLERERERERRTCVEPDDVDDDEGDLDLCWERP